MWIMCKNNAVRILFPLIPFGVMYTLRKRYSPKIFLGKNNWENNIQVKIYGKKYQRQKVPIEYKNMYFIDIILFDVCNINIIFTLTVPGRWT